MKTIYIETTVVSYLTARISQNAVVAGHQTSTRRFWQLLQNFSSYISDLVLTESGKGDSIQSGFRLDALKDIPVLEIDEETKVLAEALIRGKAVPIEYIDDAMHIAVATMNGMDFIVTWNMAHINNPYTRMMIRQICENAGYVAPEICTPEELIGGEI